MSRPFRPVILYKDECRFDLPVEKKEQIHDMLRMNGRLWTVLLSNHPHNTHTHHQKSTVVRRPSYQTPFELEDDDEDELPLDCYSSPSYEGDDSSNINKKTRKPSSSPMLSSSSSSPPSSPSSTSSSSITTARKRRGNLPKSITCLLKEWLVVHADHPYPSDDEKLYLQQETQLTINQISNWFINARRRLLPCLQAESHRISVESSQKEGRGGKKKQDKLSLDDRLCQVTFEATCV
ncbi:homeobox KN domain-domain-containing protein [Absidia repens]|uniref:Homeobox KN domain-domain-containing protein n=1 Tax=Absidia repens TaxID=90262 RepID=A0A1X2I9Y6_9FUNG|nr:homeobox KN domain-domain-containing protein [Absidia repens]